MSSHKESDYRKRIESLPPSIIKARRTNPWIKHATEAYGIGDITREGMWELLVVTLARQVERREAKLLKLIERLPFGVDMDTMEPIRFIATPTL